jgi:hypothetical protein
MRPPDPAAPGSCPNIGSTDNARAKDRFTDKGLLMPSQKARFEFVVMHWYSPAPKRSMVVTAKVTGDIRPYHQQTYDSPVNL